METDNTIDNCLYVRKSDMLSVECDDDLIILLESDNDEMLGLNATAKFLWAELESPRTLEQLSFSVATVFDVDREQASSDVMEFLNKMTAFGLKG
jgi:esterase/lipase